MLLIQETSTVQRIIIEIETEDNYRNRDKHVVLTKFDKSYEEAQILKSMQKIIQKIKKKITNAEQLLLDFMVDLGRT